MKTICDAGCKKEFVINKFNNRKVKNGIDKIYFKCPHCKHEYLAYYSSEETKKLQKEMRQLHVKMQNGISDVLINHEQELKAKIKQSMDEARRIVEG